MELQRVSIRPEGQMAFHVMFNPNQYSVEKANQFAEVGVPGLQAPIIQYVHGNTRTLTMDLYFDTYEERRNVSHYTNRIYNAPPICIVAWGNFRFRGVLDHASGKFDLFLSNGTPVRATIGVVFKEFIDVTILVQEQPTQSADHRKARIVKSGERLDGIAAEEYGQSSMWRLIAEANDLDDPNTLQAGTSLVIPAAV
jgi:hypothetical protein